MGQPAARVTDMHTCPMADGPVPHVGGPILPPAALTVLTCGLPQARVGDELVCVGEPDVIVLGAFTVLVRGQPAARLGDVTAHGGVIVCGAPTVLIG
ncbi:MAG TPA: PAAR domain-containing protein [Acetobacteraceae bacterium]|nr:PAAR domain-containing protein [Acetobacteraceae bacterium]